MKAHIGFVLMVMTSLVFVSCSKSSDTLSSTTLACYATASEVTSGGNTVSVLLTCSGGTSPYTVTAVTLSGETPDAVSGTTANFASGVTMTLTDASRTSFSGLTGTLMIADYGAEDGDDDTNEQTASISFTVGGTSTTTSTGCTIAASSTAPAVNQSVTFTLTANSGTSPYTFGTFSPGAYGTVQSGPSYLSATQAQVTAIYTSAGTATATAYVTDATGTQRSCTTTVTVGGSGSTGTFGCTVTLSQNPVYRNTGVYAIVTSTSSSSAISIKQITFPVSAGVYGTISSNAAILYFPVSGTVPLTFYVQDQYGYQASCTASEVVY